MGDETAVKGPAKLEILHQGSTCNTLRTSKYTKKKLIKN